MSPERASSSRGGRRGSRTGVRAGRGYAAAPSDRRTALLAKALAHPARVAILRHLLERGDCICGGIVEAVGLAQSTVSQHLKVLKQAGLISGEIDGPRVCYCADRGAVKRLTALLDQL